MPRTGDSMRRVTATSVVDQVTAEIRRSILSGVLKPGQELALRELATRMGVSTIPVREALRRLEGQGLLVSSSRRSSRVAPLDAADLHGIYRLRLALEPEIAGRSCLLLSDGDLAELDRIADSLGDAGRSDEEIYLAHHDFHLRLLAPAATAWDVRTLENLWRAAERYLRLAFGARDDRADDHLRRQHAHTDLMAAFHARSPEQVRAQVRHHLEENEAIAQEAIGPVQ